MNNRKTETDKLREQATDTYMGNFLRDLPNKLVQDLSRELEEYGLQEASVQVSRKGDYAYAVAHCKLRSMGSMAMHRYELRAYHLGSEIYSTGNVIDNNKFRTVEDAQAATKAYFDKHYKNLNRAEDE